MKTEAESLTASLPFCVPDAHGHCVTCSDEALEAEVLAVDAAGGMARVRIGAAEGEIDINLVDLPAPGDRLLVHGGVAIGAL